MMGDYLHKAQFSEFGKKNVKIFNMLPTLMIHGCLLRPVECTVYRAISYTTLNSPGFP